MATPPDPNLVADLTWDRVAARLRAGAPAILPVGAEAKEHGLHLPMGTDRLQADWLALELARRIDGLVWPCVGYGFYPAFVPYAGSCSLRAGTFQAVIAELAMGLQASGARTLLIVNIGLSTTAPIDAALSEVGWPAALHVKPYDGPRYREAVACGSRQAFGSHADEMETSRMLALMPDRVDMARASAAPADLGDRLKAGPLQPHDADGDNYCPTGVYGDATLARADFGAELIEAMLQDVSEAARAHMSRLGPASSSAGP